MALIFAACSCHPLGSTGPCDVQTGSCQCDFFSVEPFCDRCVPGHYGLANGLRCAPCDCDFGGAVSTMCDGDSGQCTCLPNMDGRQCSDPRPGYFLPGLDYFLYEAELAAPTESRPPSPPPIWNPVPATVPPHPIWNPVPATGPPHPIWNPVPATGPPHPIWNPVPATGPPHPIWNPAPGTDAPSPVQMPQILPKCEQYYREQGYDFKISNGHVVLVRRTKRNSRRRRQYGGLSLEPGTPLQIIPRERASGQHITWTGLGLVRVQTGAGLRFTVDNLPLSMDYQLVIRYEPELGLIPRIEAALVQGLCSQTDLDSFRKFRCIGLATEAGSPDAPEVCEGLVKSMSAHIHKGALSCGCNSEGSLSPYCSKLGGVCECKPNVIGRCCDSCASLTYGFGPQGCKPCECDPRGSESELCDQVQGQCACRREVSGRRCDRCQPGYWGFPHCRVCECNTLSEICDQDTGHCIDCRGHSSGPHCERCIEGFYGSPVSRVPCEPCLCPDLLQSGRFFALSCEQDPESQILSCRCNNGHSGEQCEQCSPGYYGDLLLSGARCVRCECNGNIDPNDTEACDGVTGLCLRCLYNTGGHHCEECRPGYYGSAIDHDCKECSCDRRGTEVTLCPLQSPCFCDAQTGQCPCRSGVRGALCDECEDGYWNIHLGCVPCSCDLANAMSNVCDKVTGQCPCQTEYGGRKCDECGENHFGNPDLQCVSCECNLEGTLRPSCDSETGECNCRVGVMGIFCDECALGYDSAFPECKECHACAKYWGHHVSDVERAAQTMRTLIPSPPNQLQPGTPQHQAQMRTLFFDLDQMKKNMTKPTTSRVGKMEVLFQKIMKLKNSIDPNCILLDPTPLLNTEIDNIGLQFRNLLSRLRNKVENPDDEDDEDTEDLLEDIRKNFELFQTEESRVKNATNAVEDSAYTRQEAKHKLSTCGGEELLGPLEKKVKDLNVINFNKQICGGSGVDCSDCGGALCVTWLFGPKCGGPDCDGIVFQSQDAIETARNTHDSIKSLPLKIQEARDKMERVNRTALETKAQSKDMQDRINSSKESFEKDKDQIKELIKKVKDYLLDNLLPAEDVEKMARAVLNINLPRSPEHIRDMIRELTDLINSTANPERDLTALEEEAKAAHELKDRAHALKNRTKDINVSDITKDIYDAEKAQDKANDDLDAASVDRDSVRDLLQEMKDKVNEVESRLMDPRLEDMNNEIDAVQRKTEKNRKQALEAKDKAESAVKNAFDSVPALNDALEKFDELKNKKSNQTQDSEAAKQLEEIKKEAEALKREVEDKLQQIEDLEQWIEKLNKRGQDKTTEVVELLKTADSLREAITRQAEEYVTCS
uniref:Uncharacterized protein n=1 Tax=Knipowitschia caucasica TaxID=637954 RepID=A0AAV2L0Z2_KNICA